MLFLDVKWCKQEYIYWSDIQQNSPEFSKYCAFIAYVKGRVCLFIVTCFFLFYSRSCQKSILIEKNSLSCFRCLFFTVCYIQCIIYYNESSDIFPILFQVREFGVIYVMLCAIWYHLHNLKNVKMTHVVVLLLVVFFTFFQLQKWYQIAQYITYGVHKGSFKKYVTRGGGKGVP